MPLDQDVLAALMLASSGLTGTEALPEFSAYAEGAVEGLKTAIITAICAGAGGSPGQGNGVGIINPGPAALAPLIQTNAIGALPPIPGGTPTPLQLIFFLALGQIATALLTAQIQLTPADNVAAGVGTVTPGGVMVQGSVIQGMIILAFGKRGLTLTPSRIGLAQAVGLAVQQFLLLGTAVVPIIGGVPTAPPTPGAGARTGTLS